MASDSHLPLSCASCGLAVHKGPSLELPLQNGTDAGGADTTDVAQWFISEIVHTAVLSLDAEGSLSRPFG
jgi:hypothetical protein